MTQGFVRSSFGEYPGRQSMTLDAGPRWVVFRGRMHAILASIPGDWLNWLFWDRSFGDRLNVLSLLVALVGFGWTILEVRKVRKRVAKAVDRMSLVQALSTGDDLRQAARAIEAAASSNPDSLPELIQRSSGLASRLNGVLRETKDDRVQHLRELLGKAIGQAHPALESLRRPTSRTARESTAVYRRALVAAVAELDQVVGQLPVSPTGQD